MSARFSTRALRAWLVMSVVLCTSCAHLPIAGRGLHPTPGKSVGRPGCGPPISYQVFRQDAFGADWSTPDGQVLWMSSADNPSRGTDWWTMNPDGSNPQRLSDFNSNGGARGFGGKQIYATVVQTPIGVPTPATCTVTWKPTC